MKRALKWSASNKINMAGELISDSILLSSDEWNYLRDGVDRVCGVSAAKWLRASHLRWNDGLP